MKIRKRAAILAAVILLTGLSGCQQQEQKDERVDEQPESDLQIGISFDSFVIERWIRDRDVFVSTATELGAQVNVQNANGDAQEQISQIEYLIDKKMDVIVVIAVDGDALKNVVQRAKAEGIKVISYDRLIKNSGTDLYISFDNEEVGRLMAQNLIENIPDGGQIFMVRGSKEDNNVTMVQNGFDEVLKDSNLEVVYEANCAGWLAEEAFGYVIEGLRKYPDVKGIMCGNDDLASYAFRALAENRMAGEVVLVGQDGELAACQRIVEGTQSMTVYKSVDELAQKAARCAVKLAKGEELETESTIDDGTTQVPFMVLKSVAVTKDNIDQVIIDGGFHMKEDVYLNVSETE